MATWPDTTESLPPGDHPYGVALWLLGRHEQLAELVDRLPGVVSIEGGELGLELDVLASAFAEYDAFQAAREERFGWSTPDESAWERWHASLPKRSAATDELLVMSGSELGRLRLLATLSGAGARLSIGHHLRSFDAEGQRLLGDWLDAVRQG
ncbi:hypothetical protein ACGFIF_42965 [Kribbella sp. NPDC049174]|uniref:hypothetical protein n=1 Tax=Kribbella sp. NPDC049174 TaxID=3364112 RepID=UPI0037225CB1